MSHELEKAPDSSQDEPGAALMRGKALVGAVASVALKSVPIVGPVLEIVEKLDASQREEKLSLLLESFVQKFVSAEESLEQLKLLTATKEGAILFKKIVQIMDNGDVDPEWLGVLATVLKRVTEADLELKFSEIAYALGQIDRLTPQALILLSNYYQWSGVRIQRTSTTSGQTVSGDWDMQAVNHWHSEWPPEMRIRLAHAFRELMSVGMIKLNAQQLALEPVGDELLRYAGSH